ncbi:MAG TPA: VOC family protein [Mucilaginibacter sp.]|nr:VOC family protein [Mucilaginibacter sp.]
MKTPTSFAPELIIPSGVTDLSFYKRAFNAVELWRLNNDDGSVHVAGFKIDGALFHVHEQRDNLRSFSPGQHKGTTVIVGLMVDDVHAMVESAAAAGAEISSPVTDYSYGYRQGAVTDPFGHRWVIEKIIDPDILMSGNYGE